MKTKKKTDWERELEIRLKNTFEEYNIKDIDLEWLWPFISSLLDNQKKQIVDNLPKENKLKLEPPELKQYEPRGSAPFFCTLCQMSEMDIMENKTNVKGKNMYFCRCSYWSDPHNAYFDKSGGKWLGWIDKKKAQEILDEFPCEENFRNQAIQEARGTLEQLAIDKGK